MRRSAGLARAFAAGSRQRAESDHEVAGGAGRSGPGRESRAALK